MEEKHTKGSDAAPDPKPAPRPTKGSGQEKPVKDYWYFWGPSLVNLTMALIGFPLMGLPGLVTAIFFLLVGIFWTALRNKRQGIYMVLSGVVAWLIGFSICGFLANDLS